MKVEMLCLEAGAREAAQRGAVTVIVDALRASATTVTALALGADAVLPVLTVEEAATFVGRPRHRVAGERQGQKCAGFDHGNSPTELQRVASALQGQTLVLSTSNGTRMVRAAEAGAAVVLVGTTLNDRAVATVAFELAHKLDREIVLVAAGEYGQYAEEDACAARCIAAHLAALGAACPADLLRDEEPAAIFHATYSADELRGLGYDQDIDFCAQRDRFEVVPILHGARLVPFHRALKEAVA